MHNSRICALADSARPQVPATRNGGYTCICPGRRRNRSRRSAMAGCRQAGVRLTPAAAWAPRQAISPEPAGRPPTSTCRRWLQPGRLPEVTARCSCARTSASFRFTRTASTLRWTVAASTTWPPETGYGTPNELRRVLRPVPGCGCGRASERLACVMTSTKASSATRSRPGRSSTCSRPRCPAHPHARGDPRPPVNDKSGARAGRHDVRAPPRRFCGAGRLMRPARPAGRAGRSRRDALRRR